MKKQKYKLKKRYKFLFAIMLVLIIYMWVSNGNDSLGELKDTSPIPSPIDNENVMLISRALVLQNEFIIDSGELTYSGKLISDNWLPFNKRTMDIKIDYEYVITYKLLHRTVTQIDVNEYIIVLGDDYEYLVPSGVEEDFVVHKEMFGGNFSDDDYELVLNRGREVVSKKVSEYGNIYKNKYRDSVESNLSILLSKFGLKIEYVWKDE